MLIPTYMNLISVCACVIHLVTFFFFSLMRSLEADRRHKLSWLSVKTK